jgi:uncharacterized protein (DUF488 family)
MQSEEFVSAYAHLRDLASRSQTAIMCAESLWWQCHRRLVSDRLVADEWEVVHILGAGNTEQHRLWEIARLDHGRVVYDVGTLDLDDVGSPGDRSS